MISSDSIGDKELFGRIAEGDEQAFSQLFYRYLPRLEPFVRDIVKTSVLTEESIQETFLRIWLHRDELNEILNPRAWIYKIAAHICFNHLARLGREQAVMADLAHGSTDQDQTALHEINLKEMRSVVQEAVQQLSERRRLIYTMSRVEGLSIREIADRLQLSPNTVKNTLGIALASIREKLESSGWLLPALILSWIL